MKTANLYPFKFTPILKQTVWGGDTICRYKERTDCPDRIGESWEIAQVKEDVSVVSNGFFCGHTLTDLLKSCEAELVGKKVWARYGLKFPLLVKFIDAHDDLSVQVHPDDAMAREYNSFGKTEMWFVVQAGKGASLWAGFSRPVTPETIDEAIGAGQFDSLLRRHPVRPGDLFYLPAGCVHAIGKGLLVLEIQQSSDITYRLYDYDRTDAAGNRRELHVEQAKRAIHYDFAGENRIAYTPVTNGSTEMIRSPYFATSRIDSEEPLRIDTGERDSFTLYTCIDGMAELRDDRNQSVRIARGETVLLPACIGEIEITPAPSVCLIECFLPE